MSSKEGAGSPVPSNSVTSALGDALALAARGWPIVWLKHRSKLPATAHGVLDASADPDTIRAWAARWPDGNIGVATGDPGPDVLDVDDPQAAGDTVQRCHALNGPVVATARGVQYYLAGTDGRTVGLGWGEWRRRGSYVVCPPSVHPSGVSYTWTNSPNGALPQLPDGLLPERSSAGAGEAQEREHVPPGAMYDYLLDLAVRLARAGERDVDVIEQALLAGFALKREPDKVYNGDARDTRRIAEWAVRSTIAERERAADGSRFSRYRSVRARPPEETESSSPTLRALDVAGMLASPPPPVPWTVDPILARGCTTMLAGREGRGKSLLALAVAAAGGRGENVAGMVSVGSLKALYVDAENGPQEAHRRVHGLSVKPGALVYVEADRFSLRHNFDELLALVEAHAPDLLILDSLRSLAPGLDENDSLQTEAALRPVVKATQQRAMATLILHHASRASGEYRGSTAIGAAVELGFTLSRIDEDPEADHRRRLSCWKSRPAAEPPPRWLAIEPVPGGGIHICEAEPFVHERARPRDDRREDVLGVLGDKPLSERKIAETARVSRTTVQRILRDLEGEGSAQQTADGWVAHLARPTGDAGHVGHPPPGAENPIDKPDLGGPGGGPPEPAPKGVGHVGHPPTEPEADDELSAFERRLREARGES